MNKLIILVLLPLGLLNAKPPQEAFNACENKNRLDDCVIDTRRGELSGICKDARNKKVLICVPNNHNKRYHTANKSDGNINKVIANKIIAEQSQVNIVIEGEERVIRANGLPNHNIRQFPNKGNPHSIKKQEYEFRIPSNPTIANEITQLNMNSFGVAINGVVFDPNAAEWYLNERGSRWRYEALSNAISLGVDENNAHIQRTGAYHYHGLPKLLLEKINSNTNDSPLIGWAADGFPIYAVYNKINGELVEMTSSYKLKSGIRPPPPKGKYDGTFVADYEFEQGYGLLDECNGKVVKTKEFPNGTYAYFLTKKFPVIPRCFKGLPAKGFTKKRGR